MAGLTTHILDLTHGTPAANVTIQLSKFEGSTPLILKTAISNGDGRLNEPLLSADEMETGEYELLFHIGDYFREKDVTLPEPPFLDKISIRFGIADLTSHYHVPLLISPWGYQVYRGS